MGKEDILMSEAVFEAQSLTPARPLHHSIKRYAIISDGDGLRYIKMSSSEVRRGVDHLWDT